MSDIEHCSCLSENWPDPKDHNVNCAYVRIAELEAELEAELDTFRDASLLLTGKLEDAQAELAALREAAQAEVDRQRHQCGILRQELQPTTAALASLLQEKGG